MNHENSPAQPPVPEVSAHSLAQELAAGTAPVLLDVREGWEYGQGALPGALHVPVGQIVAAPGAAVGLGHEQAIVTYCHHGVRSQRAGQALRAAGFAHVRSLAGGIDAWATDVDDRVGRY